MSYLNQLAAKIRDINMGEAEHTMIDLDSRLTDTGLNLSTKAPIKTYQGRAIEIEIAEQFLLRNFTRTETVNHEINSFTLSRNCENWSHQNGVGVYVPNSTLIQAALNIGCKVVPATINNQPTINTWINLTPRPNKENLT